MHILYSVLIYCQCVVLLVVVNGAYQRYLLGSEVFVLEFFIYGTQICIFMIYKKPTSARWASLGNTIVDIKRENKSLKHTSLAFKLDKSSHLVSEKNPIADKLHDAFSPMTSHKAICIQYCE